MAIYEGVWYDHAAHRLILTLSPSAAGFLSAAIVTWVQLVAVATWPIFRYVLYLVRQKLSSTKDVFYHQRQVLLRNSSSAAGAALQLTMLVSRWRSLHVRSFRRSILYLVVCIGIFALWMLCGLYAPYIYTRTSSTVLLAESPHCGWATPDDQSLTAFNTYTIEEMNSMTSADIYVQQCYSGSGTTAKCNAFPQQSLQYESSDGVCPFGNDACISVNSTVMTLDTGLLDSNRDFGINAKLADTVQYRRVSTCSPLHSRGWVNEINTTGTALAAYYAPGEVLLQYLYGPAYTQNYTFEFGFLGAFSKIPYTLYQYNYIVGLSDSTDGWVPNATFYQDTDGDVSLVFLAGNNVVYYAPVYDPVFSAGLFPEDAFTGTYEGTNITQYTSSYLTVPIGCKEQHQICLGGSGICTPLSGMAGLLNETAKLRGYNIAHLMTTSRITVPLSYTSIATVVRDREGSSLLASRTLNGALQSALLPSDQWRKEVENWFSIGLARLQAVVLSYPTGPDNPELYSNVTAPSKEEIKSQCRTQRLRDTQGYVNFDMEGLILLVAVGTGLILLGLLIERFIGAYSSLVPKWKRGHAKWLSEGLFHLHKSSLEARGVKDWDRVDHSIPRSRQYVEVGSEDQSMLEDQSVSFLHISHSPK